MSSSLSIVRKRFPNVTQVVDSTRNVRIEVQPRDCNNAKVQNHEECAMARACKRKLKVSGVIISRNMAYMVKGNKAIKFQLPPSVQKEVVAFDRGAEFEAGEYQLSKVSQHRSVGRAHGKSKYKTPRKRTGLRRSVYHHTGNIRASLKNAGD